MFNRFDAGEPCGSAYLPAVRPLCRLAPCGGPFGSRQALPHVGVSIEQVPMNHSTRGAARDCDIMHKSLQPAFYLDRQVTLLVRYSSGILTWIRQQAAGRPAGVASSMSPWIIKIAIQRRV